MKIARTIESFYPFVSGPANQAYEISLHLEKTGNRSPIFTTFYKAWDSPPHQLFDEKVEVYRFKKKAGFMKYMYAPELYEGLEYLRPDIVHAHSYRSHQTHLAYKYAKKHNIPYVLSTHSSLTGFEEQLKKGKHWPYRLYDLLTAKKEVMAADAVIVNSEHEKNEALRFGVDEHKIHVIPVGVHLEKFKSTRKKRKNVRLLFLGNISRNRRLDIIIRAVAGIKADFELEFVGPEIKSSDMNSGNYVEELKSLAAELGVSDKFHFSGPKYDDDKYSAYKDADIFVYTSDSENFGQTILEAAASGLPMVVTRVGVANELIEDGKNSFLVDKDSPEQVRDRIMELLDYRKRQLFGRRLKEKVSMGRYNWDNIFRQYDELYSTLCPSQSETQSQ